MHLRIGASMHAREPRSAYQRAGVAALRSADGLANVLSGSARRVGQQRLQQHSESGG